MASPPRAAVMTMRPRPRPRLDRRTGRGGRRSAPMATSRIGHPSPRSTGGSPVRNNVSKNHAPATSRHQRDAAQAEPAATADRSPGTEAVQHDADARGHRDQGPGIGPGVVAPRLIHRQQEHADRGHDGPGDGEALRGGPVGQQAGRQQEDARNDDEQRPAAAAEPATGVEVAQRHRQRDEADDDEAATEDKASVPVRAVGQRGHASPPGITERRGDTTTRATVPRLRTNSSAVGLARPVPKGIGRRPRSARSGAGARGSRPDGPNGR